MARGTFEIRLNRTHFKPAGIKFIRRGNKLGWLVLAMLLTFSIGTWYFFFQNNLVLSYNDARSHLNVSRRVVDSLQPGIAQLGSVWLPFPHILQLPFVGNDFLYRTGLAGSMISMSAFVLSGWFIFRISQLMGMDDLAAFVATIAFATNLNILFLQSTPMTESLLLATLLSSGYFFTRWLLTDKTTDLILAAGCTMLASLTRYDGWFLLGALTVGVTVVSLMRHGYYKAEGAAVMYGALGALGIGLWFLWNQLIFGDFLFFMTSIYSAKSQQDILFAAGSLTTRGNMQMSAVTYILAMWFNVGGPVFILGVAGFIKLILSKVPVLSKIATLVFAAVIVFNMISLYLGQSVIHLPVIPPNTWFNVRYGVLALPFFAVSIGWLVNQKKPAAILAVVVILMTSYWMYATNNVITIQDGVRGSSGYFLDDIGSWVHENADDGLILVAASSHDSLLYISNLPLKHFITEGASEYWNSSLEDPTRHAKYVIMHEGDLVYNKLKGNPNFENNYELVYVGQFSNVYKLKT